MRLKMVDKVEKTKEELKTEIEELIKNLDVALKKLEKLENGF